MYLLPFSACNMYIYMHTFVLWGLLQEVANTIEYKKQSPSSCSLLF